MELLTIKINYQKIISRNAIELLKFDKIFAEISYNCVISLRKKRNTVENLSEFFLS